MLRNQKGASLPSGIIFILIIGATAFGVYYIYQLMVNKSTTTSTQNQTEQTTQTQNIGNKVYKQSCTTNPDLSVQCGR